MIECYRYEDLVNFRFAYFVEIKGNTKTLIYKINYIYYIKITMVF